MIILYQCRFILWDVKCTIWVTGIDFEGVYTCVGADSLWKISVFSFQFYCKPKTTLKNIVFNKNIIILYTINIYNFTHQLYPQKLGKIRLLDPIALYVPIYTTLHKDPTLLIIPFFLLLLLLSFSWDFLIII